MGEPDQSHRGGTTTARVLDVRYQGCSERTDRLATEEPMELRVAGQGQEPESVAVIMRTPGRDFELAAGFLATEGIVQGREEIASVAYCELPPSEQRHNVVTVRLARPFDSGILRRNFFATSSCGVCGKASLEQVEVRLSPPPPGPVVAASVLRGLPDALRGAQSIFEQTGGLHAAGLFESDGSLVAAREDVGRHNAVDKLVGRSLFEGDLPLHRHVLQVSGRLSFEIVQKAAVAGIPVVSAVSAPSSLAVEAAESFGVTVVGFVREGRFNVYTRPERLDLLR